MQLKIIDAGYLGDGLKRSDAAVYEMNIEEKKREQGGVGRFVFKVGGEIRIYLAILTKLSKLQRFDSINYLPLVRE